MERHFLGCNKSRSLKRYAMLFTNPSKLEAVKTEFNSIYLKMEQLNKIDVDFIKEYR
jgi:Asp-tRNA(Asn)/Glu-tRNA(Gln) amidotransferase C subunit